MNRNITKSEITLLDEIEIKLNLKKNFNKWQLAMHCHLRLSIPPVGLVLGFRTHSVTIYQISTKLGNAWLRFNESTNFPGQIFLRPQSAEMCQSEWPEHLCRT